jgi:hypothetical protein
MQGLNSAQCNSVGDDDDDDDNNNNYNYNYIRTWHLKTKNSGN